MTALTDPKGVKFEIWGDEISEDGMSLVEAYEFLTGSDRSTSTLPPLTAGFWGKREENLHPRAKDGKFRHKLEGISQTQLTNESSLKTDAQGRQKEHSGLRPNDILGVSRDNMKRIVMGPGWSGIVEKRVGDDWEVERTTKFYGDLLESPFRESAAVKDDEFFIPERVNDLLPQATRRSTQSQVSGLLGRRFAQAATGKDATAAARSIDEIGGGQQTSLADYRSENYRDVNLKLHSGGGGDQNIDSAMKDSPLKSDVLVWRGGRNAAKRFGSAWNPEVGSMVGVEYGDAAYASTSTQPAIASAFAGSNDQGFLLKIIVPKGTNAIGLTPRSMSGGEDEILLDRGLRYRIVGDHIEYGLRTFDIEVIS